MEVPPVFRKSCPILRRPVPRLFVGKAGPLPARRRLQVFAIRRLSSNGQASRASQRFKLKPGCLFLNPFVSLLGSKRLRIPNLESGIPKTLQESNDPFGVAWPRHRAGGLRETRLVRGLPAP